MRNLILLLSIFLVGCKSISYHTGEQSFLKFDSENYEYYMVESLSGSTDSISVDRDKIYIYITGQEIIEITVNNRFNKIIEEEGIEYDAEVYDGYVNYETCRLIIIREQGLIGYYHSYDEASDYFRDLVIFEIK